MTKQDLLQWSSFGIHLHIDDDDSDSLLFDELPWTKIQVLIPTLEIVWCDLKGIVYRDESAFYNRNTLSSQLDFVFKKLIRDIPLDQLRIEIRWGQSEAIHTKFRINTSMRGD